MSEEQEKVQKYIIKSTPYGELQEVVKDLDKLVPLNLDSPVIQAALNQYAEEHLALFNVSNYKFPYFVALPAARVNPGKYLDQLSHKIMTIDPLKGQVIQVEDSQIELVEEVRHLLQYLTTDAASYTAKYFRQPWGVGVYMEENEEGLIITIGISSKNVQLGSFYSGEWTSLWKVQKGNLTGTIQVRAHFFESGNVQFNQKRLIKQQFQFTHNMQDNSKNIIKAIESVECRLQQELSNLYEQMQGGFFKNLRRVVPLTRTKMSWNINAIKMNRNLMGVTKQA